jgi:hypothetical protein
MVQLVPLRGIGQLSLMVFLEAFHLRHGLHDIPTPNFPPKSTPWMRIATDDKGLVFKRIRSGLATTTAFTGASLCAECDVVNKITEIERRLPFRLKWEHVRGHQDDEKKWCEMTWMEETLNVRADCCATEGLDIPRAPSNIINTIPSRSHILALWINQMDVTSKHATHLRKLRQPPPPPAVIQRFHKHCGWTEQDFDSVNWKAHHGAIQKLQCTNKKFI